jgi:hypothetical protein
MKTSMFVNRKIKSIYVDNEEEDEMEKSMMASKLYNQEKTVKDDKETKDQTKNIMSKLKNETLDNLVKQNNIS